MLNFERNLLVDDGIIVADSDESHEYPTQGVNQFLKDLDSKKITVVNGIFLDTISHNGSLKELSNKSDIFEQFLFGCHAGYIDHLDQIPLRRAWLSKALSESIRVTTALHSVGFGAVETTLI